jgi:DNA recombination protein RmuC
MPLESALAAALDVMPDLHDAAIRSNIIVATPTLLIALLRTIAAGWQEEDVAANARQIAEAGSELHERLSVFVNHLAKVGSSIAGARDAYNRAVGSLEQRLLPSARRLRELHATRAPEVRTPARVEDPVRPITTIETEIKLPPAAGDGRAAESISATRSS